MFHGALITNPLTRSGNAHRVTIDDAAMPDEARIVDALGATTRNGFGASQAAGDGGTFVPMLPDFVKTTNGL